MAPPGSSEGDSPTQREYTGQVSDTDETGLYYYNARYYHPAIGKFTQADTNNDYINRYLYVGNNPINRTDPTGHDDWWRDEEYHEENVPFPTSFANRQDLLNFTIEDYLADSEFDLLKKYIINELRTNEGYRYGFIPFRQKLDEDSAWFFAYFSRADMIERAESAVNFEIFEVDPNKESYGGSGGLRFGENGVNGIYLQKGFDYRTKLFVLEHEYTHVLDLKKFQQNPYNMDTFEVDTEINAYLTNVLSFTTPENTRDGYLQIIGRMIELRSMGYSDELIHNAYVEGKLFEVP